MICLFVRKNKYRKYILTSAIALLFVFTNPCIFYYVSGWWEGYNQNQNSVQHYDGIIVLGGGVAGYNEQNQEFNFKNSSSDRLFKAIELFKKGKADRFIFSGGSMGEIKEGKIVKDYLKTINIPEESTLA